MTQAVYLDIWQAEEIAGSGYYRIPHREWTGYSFSPGEFLRLEELEQKHRAAQARARARAESDQAAAAEYQNVLWRDLLN